MSFTRDSVPVAQFSFMDQITRTEPVRQAPPDVVAYIAEQFANGEVDRLLNMWFDNEATQTPQVGQAPQVQQAPKAPAEQLVITPATAPVMSNDLDEI